jgi:hypothetical protein
VKPPPDPVFALLPWQGITCIDEAQIIAFGVNQQYLGILDIAVN